MNKQPRWSRSPRPSRLPLLVAQACAALSAQGACAFGIDTGNQDLTLRLDTSVRYVVGVRTEGVDARYANHPSLDETETKFSKGDVITNRLDLVVESDLVYKNRHGVRFSAAGWRDFAYGSSAHQNPLFGGASGAYAGDRYNSYARKYIVGPRAEVLDAFAFTGFDVGASTVSLKLGQHNVYWGESLYSITNSIAYSQGPVDTIKAATSPGAEAKELFLPVRQLSGQVQVTPDLAVAVQYMLDWKPFRLVPGGTYFAAADGSRSDYGASAAEMSGPPLINGPDIGPSRKRGNFGVNARWTPGGMNGTLGFYYRKFDEQLPWSVTALNSATFAPTGIQLPYARGTQLYGLSLTTVVADASVGAELSYRRNTALRATAGYAVLGSPTGASYAQAEGPRGDTLHALVNGVVLLPKTALWEGGSLVAELSYIYLNKISRNPAELSGAGTMFLGTGNAACAGPAPDLACATKSALGMAIGFTPEWPQVVPGWDLSMPTSLNAGIAGNGATLGASMRHAYTWSIGLNAKYHNDYLFSLKYADQHSPVATTNAPGLGPIAAGTNATGGAVQNSHGWVALSFKTTF